MKKPNSDNKLGIVIKSHQIDVLGIGDSFGPDMVNVLLESLFKDAIELRNSDYWSISDEELKRMFNIANFIFFVSDYPTKKQIAKYYIDMSKVCIFAAKDFRNSNGIHYNRIIREYSKHRTILKTGVLKKNQNLKKEWRDKYIDLIAVPKGTVFVFTPDGKFIDQDTLHLAKFGAMCFVRLLYSKLRC